MDFHDVDHDFVTLAFHSAQPLELSTCEHQVTECLEAWENRQDKFSPSLELLQLPNTLGFFIDFNGVSSGHWPDEKSNLLGESLVREFLYKEGICSVDKTEVHLSHINFSIMAGEYGDEYLLICPVITQADNIAGIVVVCVNKYLKTPSQS